MWRESLWWSRNLLHPDYCILQSLLLRLGYRHKVNDEEASIFKWLPLSSRFMVTATSNLAGFSSLTRLISMPISIYLWYCPIYCKVLLNLISYYCVYCTGSPRLLDHQDLSCLHRHKIYFLRHPYAPQTGNIVCSHCLHSPETVNNWNIVLILKP